MSKLGLEIALLPSQWSLTRFQCMVIAGVIGASITVTIQTLKVLSKLRQDGKSIVNPLLNLLPFLIFLPASYTWCFYSSIALQFHPLTSVLLISTTFTDMVSHIMLMHICDDPLSPIGRILAYNMILLPLHVWISGSMPTVSVLHQIVVAVDELTLLRALTAFSVILTTRKLYLVSETSNLHESCSLFPL